jgi:hypothetical protein
MPPEYDEWLDTVEIGQPQPRRLAGAGVIAESIANTESGSFNAAAATFSCR